MRLDVRKRQFGERGGEVALFGGLVKERFDFRFMRAAVETLRVALDLDEIKAPDPSDRVHVVGLSSAWFASRLMARVPPS